MLAFVEPLRAYDTPFCISTGNLKLIYYLVHGFISVCPMFGDTLEEWGNGEEGLLLIDLLFGFSSFQFALVLYVTFTHEM